MCVVSVVFSVQWNESPKAIWASAELARVHYHRPLLHLGHTEPHGSPALLDQHPQLYAHLSHSEIFSVIWCSSQILRLPVHDFIKFFFPLVTPGKRPQPVVYNHTLRQLHLVNECRASLKPFPSNHHLDTSDGSRQQLRSVATASRGGFHRDESDLQPLEHVGPHR